MTTITGITSFLSQEGEVVQFSSELVASSDFLSMLVRHARTNPIKTTVTSHDLKLTEAICYWDCLPCPHQNILKPTEFETWQEFADFMGLQPSAVDGENQYLNDFLSLMGMDTITEELNPHDEMTEADLYDMRKMDADAEREFRQFLAEQKRIECYDF